MNTPCRLQLRETAIVSGDDNITGQRKFDSEGKGDALHGGDDWLAAGSPKRYGIDWLLRAFLYIAPVLHASCPLGKIETGRKVFSVSEEYAYEEFITFV
jgi:hypothetical protein